jgi:DNA-binding response OmpR family regulator
VKSFGRDAKLCELIRPLLQNDDGHPIAAAKICDFMRNMVYKIAMVRQSDAPASIEFGHFSIFPHRRQLFADGRPITLGGRAFDVLMVLIEASGAVVGKDA